VSMTASSRAERQIILLSAGTAGRRAAQREQAGRLLAEVDWPRLGQELRVRKLLPTLGPRILELSDRAANEGFASQVSDAVATGRRQGAFLQLVCARVMSMLAEAGIRSTPLKGPLLAEAIFGDPGQRLSGDVDLLVAPEQLHAAVEVVRSLGYDAPQNHVEPNGLPTLHFALTHPRGELPPVELHWRVHWYEEDFARERLLPPEGASLGDWHPARVDELAGLLLFYARDGFVDLRLAADLSGWWDKFGSEMHPGTLAALVRMYPSLARAVSVSATVAETVVGLPAAHIIGEAPAPGLRELIAIRLANPNPRSSQSQLYADIGLIDGLLAPPGGFGAFVRRQMLPPRGILAEHARNSARRRARSSVGRCLGMLARYGLTLTRLAHAPETCADPHGTAALAGPDH